MRESNEATVLRTESATGDRFHDRRDNQGPPHGACPPAPQGPAPAVPPESDLDLLHQRVVLQPPRGGGVDRQPDLRQGAALSREGYRGCFGLDFLLDQDEGTLYLGELNPR